jgi:tetratricopeptide (TPR) repeat protein
LQEYSVAIRHLRSGLDLSPDELETDSAQSLYVEGLYTLGLAYREIGDKGRAAKLFKAVQKLTPGNEAVTQSLQELS